MNLEQIERRLRELERSVRGADYVATQDEADALYDSEKHEKDDDVKLVFTPKDKK